MNILITGATGLIGSHLVPTLSDEHKITALTRKVAEAEHTLPKSVNLISSLDAYSDLNEFDAVINLAGEPIVDKRWTEKQKHIICHSRWDLTQQLVDKMKAGDNPPSVFISGSAIGFYGRQGEQIIDEYYQNIHDEFSHQICARWEAIAEQAGSEKTRVCLLRTGIVLAKQGGALEKMLPPFRMGLGGRVGSGQQYMSWIHMDDMVNGIIHLLNNAECKGAFNLTAPEPATSAGFAKTLAATLNRPCLFPVPAFVLKLALGEASDLLLYGQKVVPHKLLTSGFNFEHPELEEALQSLHL